jgi:hypothetical protein
MPDHAAALGHVVAVSGFLESLLGHILAYMTGASAAVTIAMFHSITSTDAQRAMLIAAAEQILQGAELEEFRDLMNEFRIRYSERSRLVHNLWGTSPQHADKAVWCASKDVTRNSAMIAAVTAEEQLDVFLNNEDAAIWRRCSTYTVKEIEDVHERLVQYTERVRLFAIRLREQNPIVSARLAAAEQASAEQAIEPPQETPPDQNPE